jgi:hypothetical protein
MSFPDHIWPEANDVNQFGAFGDYVGGVWGTVLAVLTLIIVFFTWKVSKSGERQNSLVAVLTEMLKTHDAIVAKAPELSSQALREFATIYKMTRHLVPLDATWSVRNRVDIAYTYTFYGLSTQSQRSLAHYGEPLIKTIHDRVSRLRSGPSARFHDWFKGHQANLSHYMRNLFAMFVFIEESRVSEQDKQRFAKVVRTKLSNYDQALLAANVISHLGAEWEHAGLVNKFKPFANVPRHFFGYDPALDLKSLFPMVQYEWEKQATPRPAYHRAAIGALKIVWYREWYRAA